MFTGRETIVDAGLANGVCRKLQERMVNINALEQRWRQRSRLLSLEAVVVA
jgi:hypothetical protein